jgi:hypothetical protein
VVSPQFGELEEKRNRSRDDCSLNTRHSEIWRVPKARNGKINRAKGDLDQKKR